MSPTSALITGPKNPRCFLSAGVLGLRLVNVASVKPQYRVFRYLPPIRFGPFAKNVADVLKFKILLIYWVSSFSIYEV